METDRHTPSNLVGRLMAAQTDILNLKTELVAYAYHDEASPFMRRAILSSLAHAGLFNGDVDAEVMAHPNYTTAFMPMDSHDCADELEDGQCVVCRGN